MSPAVRSVAAGGRFGRWGLALLGAVACQPAQAPRYPAVARALMERVDQDGDHKVDADEYYLLLLPGGTEGGGAFSALDTDGSGDLSEAELEAGLLATDPVEVRHAALAAEKAAQRAALEPPDQGPAGEPGSPDGLGRGPNSGVGAGGAPPVEGR
jgi:hypothetical protein